MPSTKEILEKYSRKLESQIEPESEGFEKMESEEYIKFKKEMVPELSRYERFAKGLSGIVRIKIAEKNKAKMQVMPINLA